MVYFNTTLTDGRSLPETGVEATEDAGPSGWIQALLDHHGPQVRSKLCAILRHGPDVEDAYQSAICHLASQDRARIAINSGGYFYRTALNAAIEILRARRCAHRHREELVTRTARRMTPEDPAGPLAQRDAQEHLRAAISELPAQLRRVVLLRDLTGLPYRQVGEILGIRPTTARLYRRQAIIRLAEMLRADLRV